MNNLNELKKKALEAKKKAKSSSETSAQVEIMKNIANQRGKKLIESYNNTNEQPSAVKNETVNNLKTQKDGRGRPSIKNEPMKTVTFNMPIRIHKALRIAVLTHETALGSDSMSEVISNLVEEKLKKIGAI